MYAVAAPKNATTHIQKTAPGPPKPIAAATPAILPVPTRPDNDTAKAWKDEIPCFELLPDSNRRHISRKCLI